MLAGILPVQTGTMQWYGHAPKDWSTLFVGHGDGLQPQINVINNLRHLCTLQRGMKPSIQALNDALEWAGLLDHEHQSTRLLSAGQRRRVQLARLYVDYHQLKQLPDTQPHDKRLWLLDEPLTALDKRFSVTAQQLMQSFMSAGGRIIFTSHQPLTQLVSTNTQVLDLNEFIIMAQHQDDLHVV